MIQRILLLACLALGASPALAQQVNRAGHAEFYLSPIFTDSKSWNFADGSNAQQDTGYGLAMGYAFNVDNHFSWGGEFSWGGADYRANVAPGAGNGMTSARINGTLETWGLRFLGNYYFGSGRLAPFVTGGFGWTTIDTNIPNGLPQNICWAYPWWGAYCGTYVPTKTTTKFSYNGGVGLRYDFGGRAFIRGLVNSQWADFGGTAGTLQWTQYRFDIGTLF